MSRSQLSDDSTGEDRAVNSDHNCTNNCTEHGCSSSSGRDISKVYRRTLSLAEKIGKTLSAMLTLKKNKSI